MKKVAILLKDGFEELEALSVLDVCRRAGIEGELIGMDSEFVASSHNLIVKAYRLYDDEIKDFDAVVIPGGMPGAKNLQKDHRVLELVKMMFEANKIVAAICAGPIVLQAAGALKNKTVTCYPGFEDELTDANYKEALVIKDKNIITGKGPTAGFAFAYEIVEALGIDSEPLKESMQYHYLINH